MIQSKFKYNAELGAKASKLAFKLRSKKKDLLINIFVPIAILLMIGLLIFDIYKDNNIVLDVVLLVLLTIVEFLNIFMPLIISHSQKKYLKNLEMQNFDYNISEYNKGKFKEKIYKDNKLVYANEIPAERVVNFCQFEHYYLVIFENFASIIFDLDNLEQGTKEDLIKEVTNITYNNRIVKPKRR